MMYFFNYTPSFLKENALKCMQLDGKCNKVSHTNCGYYTRPSTSVMMSLYD